MKKSTIALSLFSILFAFKSDAQTVTGSGTLNYLTKWTATGSTAGNSSLFDNGNIGLGTTTPFTGLTNSGMQINKGGHSMLILGDPVTAHTGGVIQASDDRHRIFIGANLCDDLTNSWKSMQTGKGAAGISILADQGGWGTSIDFMTSPSDGGTTTRMTIDVNGKVGIGTGATTLPNQLTLSGDLGIRCDPAANVYAHKIYASPLNTRTIRFDCASVDVTGGWEFYNSGASQSLLYIKQGGNVGINNTSPSAKLQVTNGSVLFDGSTATTTTPASGAGTRMMWIPTKAAFRAGNISSTQWDDANIGYYSFAVGYNAKASGQYSFAAGSNTNAIAYYSTAFGVGTTASGSGSTAFGQSTTASGTNSTAFGTGTTAASYYSFVLGAYNVTGSYNAATWVEIGRASCRERV